ncbi:MAG: aminotransferase class V-fold PLP-dependent enzyme [Planctomycetes bacterium]|nr:aminotransferase class V-fold PLP-dependent enzyme [Planctomycetota bacterium]
MSQTRRQFIHRGAALGTIGVLALRQDALARIQAATQKAGDRTPDQLASDEDFWIQIQQAYTVDRSMINLNNGGVSPAPRVVQDAMRRHLEFANNAPAKNLWQIQDPQVENVRARVALVFGCSPEELAITRNASESLQICIYGIDLKPGDEVLACELDYPRMLNTYRQRELRDGIKLRLAPIRVPVESPEDVVQAYRAAMTPQTKVMLVSHVVFVSGQIHPVRELIRLGRERSIPVIVDGAHAFAHLAFKRDDLECDYYGVSLHKWMTAPHGTGFLYVRDRCIESLWPLMAAIEPRSKNIRKFEEIGTHPAANYLAIAEAVTLHNAIGPARKEARLRYLRNRWANRLLADKRVRLCTRLEPVHSGGFVTFSIEGMDNVKLHEHLWAKHKIFTVAIDYPEKKSTVRGIRVSPNTYTTIEEIDAFSAAVEDVLANGLPA